MQIKSYDLTFISAGNYEYKEEMVVLEGPGGELESRKETRGAEDVSYIAKITPTSDLYWLFDVLIP